MAIEPVREWPELRRPFLVVALQGWVDAGSSGQLASAALRGGWDMKRIALYDSDEFVDYQHRRPRIQLDEDGRRRVAWQEIELLAGDAGRRDALLLTGPEPARNWRTFIDETVALCQRFHVEQVFNLGGLPAAVPHTQPVPVAGTATTAELTEKFDRLLGSYEGPTGTQTALQVGMGDAGIAACTLWAQVPHYLSAMVWPGGALALLARLGADTNTLPPINDLVRADNERRAQVDAAVTERPDVQELVRALEGGDIVEDIPSGDDLAAEIERFLAQESGGESSD